MTKAELIARLAPFPDHLPILVNDYEADLTNLAAVRPVNVQQVRQKSKWTGEFEVCKPGRIGFRVILLSRYEDPLYD